MRDIASPLDGFASPFGPGRRTLTNLLFGNNEPGFTFEPWDITTLYQDRAGTTPVTAVGQSVGLRLSKDQGLRIGPERVANGSFHSDLSGWTLGSDAAQVIAIWTASGASLTRGAGGPNGFTQTGVAQVGKTYLITFDVVSGTAAFDAFGVSVVAGGAGSKRFIYVASTTSIQFWPTANNATVVIDNISVRELAGNHEVAINDAARGVYGREPKTGRRNLLNATATLSTQSVTVTAVAHTLAFTGTGTVTLSGVSTAGPLVGTGAGNRVTLTFTPTAGSLTLTVTGSVTLAQLQIGSVDTAYQAVVSQYDITEAGVASCYYVQTDGVDDAYVTPTITPGTDKVQVFAGVRKNSDAAIKFIVETSTNAGSNAGSLMLYSGTDRTIQARARGSVDVALATTALAAAPLSFVATLLGDISGDASSVRINGVSRATSSADHGTGNYLAYPAYIYARAGTSFPFNGRDYGHAVRFGPNLDAATIAQVEALIARNTPTVTL